MSGKFYWYCYLSYKKQPSSSFDGGIPEETCTCKKVNYLFLKNFGCEEFVHINKENRTNLEEKSKKCTFTRYGVNDLRYHLYDYENHKIIRTVLCSDI